MKLLFFFVLCREITLLIYCFPITNYCVDPFVSKLNYRIENEMFIVSCSCEYIGQICKNSMIMINFFWIQSILSPTIVCNFQDNRYSQNK